MSCGTLRTNALICLGCFCCNRLRTQQTLLDYYFFNGSFSCVLVITAGCLGAALAFGGKCREASSSCPPPTTSLFSATCRARHCLLPGLRESCTSAPTPSYLCRAGAFGGRHEEAVFCLSSRTTRNILAETRVGGERRRGS